MAREGRTSGKTSFGKRTQAEKNFRDKKKGKSSSASGSDEPRERSFSGRNQPGKTFGRKTGTSFRKRDEGPGERKFSKPAFRKTDDRFSKFKKDDSSKRPRFEGESRE